MKFSLRRVVGLRMMATAGLAAILAACGGSVSNSAIDFTASLLDGSPITLGEQLGQRPVALWFWAPG